MSIPSHRPSRRCVVGLALLLAVPVLVPLARSAFHADEPAPAKLALKAGDHIAFIGNTLPDRMQHDGWLETLLQSRFPGLGLVFRNLGFSGDELTLRLRDRKSVV